MTFSAIVIALIIFVILYQIDLIETLADILVLISLVSFIILGISTLFVIVCIKIIIEQIYSLFQRKEV